MNNLSVFKHANPLKGKRAERRKPTEETDRRRKKQLAYNAEHGIKPETIRKEIRRGIEIELRAYKTQREAIDADEQEFDRETLIAELQKQMYEAAESLEFEKAARLRDKVKQLQASPTMAKVSAKEVGMEDEGKAVPGAPGTRPRKKRKRK